MSEDGDQEVIKEPPKEDPGKKFFISHLNTQIGQVLL